MHRFAVFTAALLAFGSLGAPAYAGTGGGSTACFDGGWTDIPVLSSPVTLGIETNVSTAGTWVTVCYATSEVGSSAAHVTGGFAKIWVASDGSGFFQCWPDSNPYVVYLSCGAPFSFEPTTGGLSVTFEGSIDTNVAGPVIVGQTGLVVSPFVFIWPGVSVVPRYPCVYVLGLQVVPNCGAVIL